MSHQKAFDRLNLAFLIGMIYLAFDGLNFYLLEERITHFRRVMTERDLTISSLISLLNVETGCRGYLLSRDKSFLVPMDEGKISARKQLQQLDEMTKTEEADQRAIVVKFKTIAASKISLESSHILVPPSDKKTLGDKALQGKALMDQYRALIDKLIMLEDNEIAGIRATGAFWRGLALIVRFLLMAFLLSLVWPRKSKMKTALGRESNDSP